MSSQVISLDVHTSGRLMTPLEIIKHVLAENWDGERLAYALPRRLILVVGEPGFGGSHTPSMVGAVEAWRKRNPEKAKAVWVALADANLSVEKGLLRLKDAAHSEDSYKSTLQANSTSTAD